MRSSSTALGTRSGGTRSISRRLAPARGRGSRSSSTAAGPVTASIRRTLAALEVSLETVNSPISAVERTCVPPHSSREKEPSPTSTIRTTSPYFSPNSAIAPSRRASSSVVVSARTGWLSRIQLVDLVLDVRELLGGERLAVREVEAQLVGPDVGAGLVHVAAEPLAQRGVQQVGGGVVALGRVAGGAVDARVDALAGLERARARGPPRRTWSSPSRSTSSTRARQSPSLALDVAGVGDLAAAGGVERRLDAA